MTLSFRLKIASLLTIGALGAIFLGSLIGGSAHAQANTSRNITMSPASTLISLNPGETAQESFQILNTGGDAYSIATAAYPYSVKGLEYDPQFTQLPGTTETAKWVKIMSPLSTVAPQKSVEIKYSVTVPQGTAPGGYYAVLFAETRPVDPGANSGVVPRNRVGNILYITVKGPVKTSGDVSVDAVGGFRYQANIPIGFKVKNDGGVHFLATLKASVKSFTGKELYNASIERYVLPQTEREVNIDWAPPSPVGIYTVKRSAHVAGADKQLPDQTFVYIQPWVIVFALVLIASIILFFVTRASQRRKKRSEKKSKE